MHITAIKRAAIGAAILGVLALEVCATSTQFNVITQIKGILAVANGGTGTSTATGSGNLVLATSPSLTTTATLTNNNIVTTPTDGFLVQNTTASTAGVPVQYSPNIHLKAQVWNTTAVAANNSADWIMYVLPTSGTSPYSNLEFASSINGGAYGGRANLDSFGDFSAGTFQATSAFKGPAYTVNGTKFTASGCTNSTTVGGSTAGSFKTGAAGACTITITMGGGQTATDGWVCYANDLTTAAGNPIHQTSASTTTTAVLVSSSSTASGDVINWGCQGY